MKIIQRIAFLLLIFSLSINSISFAQKKGKEKNKDKDEQNEDFDLSVGENQNEYLFSEGMKFFVLEEYPKAQKMFETCLKNAPQEAGINFALAQTLFKLNKLPEAQRYAQNAVKLNPKNKFYYLLLAKIYETQENREEAAKTYVNLIDNVKNSEEHYVDLALIYLQQSKLEDAIKAYDKAEKKFGVDEHFIKKKQQIYLALKNIDGALREGQKLIDANPSTAEYYIAQAELLLNQRKIDEARKVLSQALEASPNNPYVRLMLSDVYQLQGDREKQNRELEIAFAHSSLGLDAKMNVVRAYLKTAQTDNNKQVGLKLAQLTAKQHPENAKINAILGDFQRISGLKKESLDSYLKSTSIDGNQYRIWEEILQVDWDLQEFANMVKHSEQAIEFFPNQATLWFYNGVGFAQQGKYGEAIDVLEQSKMLASDNPELRYQLFAQLGDAYNGAKNYAKSDEHYEKALEVKPDEAYVLNNYSYYLSMRKDKLNRAKELSARLVQLNPENASFLDTYGWVLYTIGDFENAKTYLQKAATHTAANGTMLEHYGDVLFQLNQPEEALKYWQKAKQAGKTSEQIDRKIAEKKLYE